VLSELLLSISREQLYEPSYGREIVDSALLKF